MKAFNGDIGLKYKVIGQVKDKIAKGQLIHGTYGSVGEDGITRGCAVFVTTCNSTSPHQKYPDELGIPLALARLEDLFFENLKPPHDSEWPVKFLEAIKEGADLSLVTPKFLYWLMQECLQYEELWRKHDKEDDYTYKVVAALNQVAAMLKEWYETGKIPAQAAWAAARAAAQAAAQAAEAAWAAAEAAQAAEAAWAAAEAAQAAEAAAEAAQAAEAAWAARAAARAAAQAAEAAWAAAEAARAAWAAAEAAWAAARAAAQAAEAAWAAFFLKMSEKLLELMRECAA